MLAVDVVGVEVITVDVLVVCEVVWTVAVVVV